MAKRKSDDTEFEIQFYEGILEKREDFLEALMVLGDLYTKKGLVEKGLKVDEKLNKLRPKDPIVLYNLACSYSLMENVDKSLDTIKRAIDSGYDDIDFLERDIDLKNLKNDDRFKEYLSSVKKKVDR